MPREDDWFTKPPLHGEATITQSSLISEFASGTISAFTDLLAYMMTSGTGVESMTAARDIVKSAMETTRRDQANEEYEEFQVQATYALACTFQLMADAYHEASGHMIERVKRA